MEPTTTKQRKRSKSLTDEIHQFRLLRMNQPDRPIHQFRDSLFSVSSGFNNYRGFFNLAIILLCLTTARVALENLIKYGILINYSQVIWLFLDKNSIWQIAISVILLHISILFSYWIEIQLSKNRLTEDKGLNLVFLNLTLLLLGPIIFVLAIPMHVVIALFICIIYLVGFLKLFSYHHVNFWCRSDRKKGHKRHNSGGEVQHQPQHQQQPQQQQNELTAEQHLKQLDGQNGNCYKNGSIISNLIVYPYNLRLSDIIYFVYAPTLCYELNFPRSERIRKRVVLKRLFEVVFLTQLMVALTQQWMVPTIHNSLKPLEEMDYFRMLERLLKLAIPNHVLWLIGFYTYFHSYLNLSAELLRFGDREFYRDWWNAESVSYFWRNWNIPVHSWCVRHLYIPMKERGYSKEISSLFVFLISAIFHEYLVSIPLRMFSYWAFLGMFLQIPLLFLIKKGNYANAIVWISLIIGQPLGILACYHDYYVLHCTSN